MARMIFSPTTEPMLPPMKRKSMTASTTSWPSTLHSPVTTASFTPVFRAAAASFSSYSGNASGLVVSRSEENSWKTPSSAVYADALPGGQTEVVPAVRADVQGGFQLRGAERALAGRAGVLRVDELPFVALPLHRVLRAAADPSLDPVESDHRMPSFCTSPRKPGSIVALSEGRVGNDLLLRFDVRGDPLDDQLRESAVHPPEPLQAGVA